MSAMLGTLALSPGSAALAASRRGDEYRRTGLLLLSRREALCVGWVAKGRYIASIAASTTAERSAFTAPARPPMFSIISAGASLKKTGKMNIGSSKSITS